MPPHPDNTVEYPLDPKPSGLEIPATIELPKLPTEDEFPLKEDAQIIFDRNKKQIDEKLLAHQSTTWTEFVTNFLKPLWIKPPEEYICTMLRSLIIGRYNGTAPHPILVKTDYDKFFTHFGTDIKQIYRVLLELHNLDCFIGFADNAYAKDLLSRPPKEKRKGLYLCRTSATPHAFVFCVWTDKGIKEFKATLAPNGLYNFYGKELKLTQIPEQFNNVFEHPYSKYLASIEFW